MLIQFYVCLSFISFLLGFGVRRQCDTVCFCLKETETHKNEEATGCQRRTFKLLQTLTTSVLAFVSHLIFPFLPSLPASYSSFFSTLLHLATIKLKKETRQHAEVPRSAGIINKSAEEEVNCCNQLIQPTAADGERF